MNIATELNDNHLNNAGYMKKSFNLVPHELTVNKLVNQFPFEENDYRRRQRDHMR